MSKQQVACNHGLVAKVRMRAPKAWIGMDISMLRACSMSLAALSSSMARHTCRGIMMVKIVSRCCARWSFNIIPWT